MRYGGMLGLAVCLGALAVAQQGFGPDEVRTSSSPYLPPPPPNTLRTEVNLVEVPVVVRDGKHRAIGGLMQGDFEIFDAGKKQTITAFSVETFVPAPAPAGGKAAEPAAVPVVSGATPPKSDPPRRFVVLCFDNLSTGFADLKRTKDAAEKFVRTGMTPGDLMAVTTTAWPGAATFTADVPKLVESIQKVTVQSRFSDEGLSQCPRMTPYQAYVIVNRMDNQTLEGVVAEDMACKNLQHQRAVEDVTSIASVTWEHAKNNTTNTLYAIRGMVDALGKLPGRRMLLLASSGFLSGNLEDLEDALITRAVRAEVVINALNAKGLYTYSVGRPIDAPPVRGRSQRTQIAEASIQGRQEQSKDDGMAVLALGTGGSFYHNSNDLNRGFQELGVVPEVVYVLGFSPGDAAEDGRYHPLKVKLAAGNRYSLQSRLGYTTRAKRAPVEQRAPSKLDLAVMASDAPAEVPASLNVQGQEEAGTTPLTMVVHLDVGKLPFEMRGDRRALKLIFLTALFDAGGVFLTGVRSEMDLAIKQESFDRLAGPGFNIRLPVRAPAGKYTLRGVVQAGEDGKLTAASMPVDVK